MNFGIIIKVLGSLLLFEAIALLVPLGISIYYAEPTIRAFVYTILLLVGFGIPMSQLPNVSQRIKAKEALLIVTLGWISVALFGALPFYLSGSIPSMVDAIFETVSGLTTTGATIIDDIEVLSKSILFWRSLTHWLGGMGILVLTLAILPAVGVGGFQIFKAESPGPISDKLVPRMADTAKILYTVYLGLTVLQTIFLYVGGMTLYEALVHTFGTVGTGGFSTRNASIGGFSSMYITMVIAIFMIAAGVNFSLYYDLYQRRWNNVVCNTELHLYLGIIFVAVTIITLELFGARIYPSLFAAFQHALFQVGAFITTTGYTTVDYEQWTDLSKGILFFLMFVGGSAGSTAGSVKIIRLLVMFKLIGREIRKILHPRAHVPIRLHNKVLSPGKFLLSFMMLLGRLELFTLFILLMPSFWRE